MIASLSCTVFSSVTESKPRELPLLNVTPIPVRRLRRHHRSYSCYADVQITTTFTTPSFVRLPAGPIPSQKFSLSPFTPYCRIFNFESIHLCLLPVNRTPLSTKSSISCHQPFHPVLPPPPPSRSNKHFRSVTTRLQPPVKLLPDHCIRISLRMRTIPSWLALAPSQPRVDRLRGIGQFPVTCTSARTVNILHTSARIASIGVAHSRSGLASGDAFRLRPVQHTCCVHNRMRRVAHAPDFRSWRLLASWASSWGVESIKHKELDRYGYRARNAM